MNNMVLWQRAPSIHQSSFIRALAGMHGRSVTLVTTADLSHRRGMGWTEPDFGPAHWIPTPSTEDVDRLLAKTGNSDYVHIFSGIGAYPDLYRAFRRVLASRAVVGVVAEAADPRGWRGLARRIVYTRDAMRFRRHLDFILAIGSTGMRWFAQAGFNADRMYPFGYFVEGKALSEPTRDSHAGIRVAYVGQLYNGKGVDLLLLGLAALPINGWKLDVVGDGKDRVQLQELGRNLGLGSAVTWHGFQSNATVVELLSHVDLLVLPSRYDGWGAVVNEALMVGTPVICSDACGAADLIASPLQGGVVPAGNAHALQTAIAARVQDGAVAPYRRAALREWARCISGESGARYFIDVVNHAIRGGVRPVAPWLSGGV